MPKFPAQPPAPLGAIQQLKTKLYANESLMSAEAVGFSQTDESGDGGDPLLCGEREAEGVGNWDTCYCNLHAVCILL